MEKLDDGHGHTISKYHLPQYHLSLLEEVHVKGCFQLHVA
jgi:hypothetical protein